MGFIAKHELLNPTRESGAVHAQCFYSPREIFFANLHGYQLISIKVKIREIGNSADSLIDPKNGRPKEKSSADF